VIEDQQAVEPLGGAVEIVGRHQHREPARDQTADQRQQRVLGGGVDAGRRLVEE